MGTSFFNVLAVALATWLVAVLLVVGCSVVVHIDPKAIREDERNQSPTTKETVRETQTRNR